MFALKQNESGLKAEKVGRKMGVNKATFYNWDSASFPTDKIMASCRYDLLPDFN